MPPNVATFNTLIAGYARLARADDAAALYAELLRRKLAPDVYTFSALINAFAKVRAGECKRDQSDAISCSSGDDGAVYTVPISGRDSSGFGRALRSVLPLGVFGSSFRKTIRIYTKRIFRRK